jgi:hypothetical protein
MIYEGRKVPRLEITLYFSGSPLIYTSSTSQGFNVSNFQNEGKYVFCNAYFPYIY